MRVEEDAERRGLVERAAYLLGVVVGRAACMVRAPQARREPGAPRPSRVGHRRPRRSRRAAAASRRVRAEPGHGSESAPSRGAPSQLQRALADPDPSVRRRALRTVAELDPDTAGLLLAGTLHDVDAGVRRAAVVVAARVRSPAVGFALVLALDDSDPEVRAAAQTVVEELSGRAIDPSEMADPAARRRIIEELKRWWKEQRLAQLARIEGTA